MKTYSTFRAPLAAMLTICLIFPPIAFAGGKAGKKYFEEGAKHESSEQWDLASERYALAVAEDPGNAEYRLRLPRAAQMASLMFIARAAELKPDDHLARFSGTQQGGATTSIEEVIFQAEAEEEQERRRIAQRSVPSGLVIEASVSSPREK